MDVTMRVCDRCGAMHEIGGQFRWFRTRGKDACTILCMNILMQRHEETRMRTPVSS